MYLVTKCFHRTNIFNFLVVGLVQHIRFIAEVKVALLANLSESRLLYPCTNTILKR